MFVSVRLSVQRLRRELLICLTASMLLVTATLWLASAAAYTSAVQPLPSWIGLVAYERGALLCLPIVAGLMYGTSLFAAELDQGTSVFAWSIVRNRRRWLAESAIAGGLIVFVTSVPIALASHLLSSSLGIQLDADLSPAGVDPSAILVVARPLAAFGIAALVSMVIGRSLPTLVVALVVSLLVLGALEVGFSTWRTTEVTQIDASKPGVLYVGNRLVTGDGRLLSDRETTAVIENGASDLSLYRQVPVGLDPQARASLLACQVASTLGACLAALVVAGALVDRRRPM